jgi:hypothetical protein
VHTVTVGFRLSPLPDVGVVVEASPDAVALLEPLNPLTIINLAVGPGVNTLAIRFSVLEVAVVTVAVRVPFKGLAMAEVLVPLALILASVLVLHDSLAVALPIFDLAHKQTLLKALFFEVCLLLDFFQVHFVGFKDDFFEFELLNSGEFAWRHWVSNSG